MSSPSQFWDGIDSWSASACCFCGCCVTKIRRIEVTVSVSEVCSTTDENSCTWNRTASGSVGPYTMTQRPAGELPNPDFFDLTQASVNECLASNTANKLFNATGNDVYAGPDPPCLNDTIPIDEEHEVSVSVDIDCFGVGTVTVTVLGPFGGGVDLDMEEFGTSVSDSTEVNTTNCTTTVSATVTIYDTDA